MKKVFIYIIFFLSLIFLTGCSIEFNEKEKDDEPQIIDVNQDEYVLKVSRLLNKVQKNNNDFIKDKTIIDELLAFSFKVYNLLASDVKENYAISPVSLYFALSLLYEVGSDVVKEEIEELLGVSKNTMINSGLIYKDLTWSLDYSELGIEHEKNKIQPVSLSNSIWLDNNITNDVNQEVLDDLAVKYFCHAFETTFKDDNEKANEDVRAFVKEQTKGLIDNDFNLHQSTLFALINTLFFHDKWREFGKLNTSTLDFTLSDGSIINVKDVIGAYQNGMAYENEEGRGFFSTTINGYHLFFLVPNEGHAINELMNVSFFNSIVEEAKKQPERDKDIIHQTRVIFPAFKVKTEIECQDEFKAKGYLQNTLREFSSPLIDEDIMVSRIIHQTNLEVDEEGIIGAAVTIVESRATSAYAEYKYHDFVVDQNFGFVITSPDGIVLFMGQIENPTK